MIFKKSHNALPFWLIIYDFFNQDFFITGVLTNQKLEINMPQIFKTKYTVNFRKYRSRKTV